jgi:ADP-ribose pyrophosphatase YjhB (NUDIX family)/ribosomal protein S27AE
MSADIDTGSAPVALRFCPACGADGLARPEPKRLHCADCGFTLFLNAATAAGAILTHDDHLVLTVRRHEPAPGWLDLPGGFVDPGEGVEQSLRRELREELGIAVNRLNYVGSWPNVYPYGGVVYSTCDIIFAAALQDRALQVGDDVSAVEWHPIANLPLDRVAFSSARAALAEFARTARLA